MESTGVYWIPVFEILEQRGFTVVLVNATGASSGPTRASRCISGKTTRRPATPKATAATTSGTSPHPNRFTTRLAARRPGSRLVVGRGAGLAIHRGHSPGRAGKRHVAAARAAVGRRRSVTAPAGHRGADLAIRWRSRRRAAGGVALAIRRASGNPLLRRYLWFLMALKCAGRFNCKPSKPGTGD
jgi:hypothetical protein